MPFIAGNLIVTESVVKEMVGDITNGEGSLKQLRNRISSKPLKKVRVVDDTLITYKQSSFMSDMIQTDKD